MGYIGNPNFNSGQIYYGNDTGAGHVFNGGPIVSSGQITAPTYALTLANFYITSDGGANSIINFDAGDALYYNRSLNKYYFNIGGQTVASIDGAGNLRVIGNIIANTTP